MMVFFKLLFEKRKNANASLFPFLVQITVHHTDQAV